MKYFFFLGLTCLCTALFAGEETPTAKPTEPCPSCEKGTSRLAAFQGEPACPENCDKLCCTGKTVTFALPSVGDQKSAAKVAFTINSIDGAIIEESCLNSHCSTIKYDPDQVTKAKLINELEKIGIEVAGEKLSYQVAGMTCTGCSGKLTDVLTNSPGVISIESVSHETKSASLVIDPNKTNANKIVKVINETGYKVVSE